MSWPSKKATQPRYTKFLYFLCGIELQNKELTQEVKKMAVWKQEKFAKNLADSIKKERKKKDE